MAREGKAAARTIERFHHLAIVMLRGMRAVDEATGFTGPRASALSVLVFGGPRSLGELAAAEGVAAPTMSRLVKAMQDEGLVESRPSPGDQRRVSIAASAKGRRLLMKGRARRLAALAKLLENASPRERAALVDVVGLLARALEGKRRARRSSRMPP
ncbi:MAG: MarR family winged helix-turn-helix transcriptional regulator [Usitatibacter sp.]